MFPRPTSHARKPSDLSTMERPRSSWESSYQSPLRNFHQSTQRASPTVDAMEPESSDSDVSVGGGDEYRFASPLTAPIPLPPPPSKHALESSDAVQARLDELQRVEEHNIKKYELLKAKRSRKDEKIRRKREIQDKKWAAILDARHRRDTRIEARRKREDAAFSQFFDQELEEEENSLRRRLKRLKRGLPPEESPQPSTAKVSTTSMSPLGSTLSTIPPPPKRHQVGPPGQPDSVNPTQSRPSPQSNLATASKSTFSSSPYSFFRDPSSAFARPYHPTSSYSTTPNAASSTTTTNGLGNSPQASTERSLLSHLGRPSSPFSKPGPPVPSPATPTTPANPPRQTSSNYDTRPPPTTAPGFGAVNSQTTSGFAAINPRTTSSSPLPPVGIPRPPANTDANKTPNHQIINGGIDSTRFHSYAAPTGLSSPAGGSNKRTPSTTHPYQMSEAFANRHHHCERVDSLNRGIWTSYGVGGSKDHPTGPAVEMYLRCNHDGCSRIDWRTVHGLQCHIVKNHAQPKGTIGSLDKALEKYGVPVNEIEEHERIHGRGSGGTVADPKNHKIKIKTAEASGGSPASSGDRASASYAIDPDARPAGYRPSPTSTSDSPPASDGVRQSPKQGDQPSIQKTESATDDPTKKPATPMASTMPRALYSANSWLNSYMSPRRLEPESKRLQGDFGMSETQGKHDPAPTPAAAPAPAPAVAVNGDSPVASSASDRVKLTGVESSGAAAVEDPAKAPINADNPPPATTSPPHARPSAKEDGDVNSIRGKSEAESTASAPIQDAPPSQVSDKVVSTTGIVEQGAKGEQSDKVDGQAESTKTDEVRSQEKAEPEAAASAEDHQDHSRTIVVDGDAGKDTAARKKAPPSPSMTTKTVPATTPTSAKRVGRRSSMARRSVDADGDVGSAKDRRASINVVEEKDDKEVKEEKDAAKPEPRRSLNGRLLRRGRV